MRSSKRLMAVGVSLYSTSTRHEPPPSLEALGAQMPFFVSGASRFQSRLFVLTVSMRLTSSISLRRSTN